MKFAYVRVSSKEQNVSRQIEALKSFDSDLTDNRIYIDHESGKDFDRFQYQELKKTLREGDVLFIKELDRLGRNKEQIKLELTELKNKSIKVKIFNIPTTLIDFPIGQEWVLDMVNNILIEVLSAIAEEDRITIQQRQKEGIVIAKRDGKYTGRKNGTTKVDMKSFAKIYNQVKEEKITVSQAIILLDYTSRSSFYNMKKRYDEIYGKI